MENSKDSLEFTEPENKIRKKWLFWSVLLSSVVLGGFVIIAICELFIAANFTAMLGVLLLALILAGGLYMNYYCSYKNPGTILLLLGMIAIPLNLFTTFLKPTTLALMKVSIVFSLVMLIILFWEVVMFYYSYKLRKINKEMRDKRLMACALSAFSTATNLQELDEQFTSLKVSHSRSAVKVLAKAYDQQKKLLTLTNNSLND